MHCVHIACTYAGKPFHCSYQPNFFFLSPLDTPHISLPGRSAYPSIVSLVAITPSHLFLISHVKFHAVCSNHAKNFIFSVLFTLLGHGSGRLVEVMGGYSRSKKGGKG